MKIAVPNVDTLPYLKNSLKSRHGRQWLVLYLVFSFSVANLGVSLQARAGCREGCDSSGFDAFLGEDALLNSGTGSTAVGYHALQNNSGNFNVGVGQNTLLASSGGENVATAVLRWGIILPAITTRPSGVQTAKEADPCLFRFNASLATGALAKEATIQRLNAAKPTFRLSDLRKN